jgi:predicted DNA-binding transcriptional regulator AlpA
VQEITNNEEPTFPQQAVPGGAGLWTRKRTSAWLEVSLLWLWRAGRNPALGFPKPLRLGGPRSPLRYVAAEVQAWALARRLAGRTK